MMFSSAGVQKPRKQVYSLVRHSSACMSSAALLQGRPTSRSRTRERLSQPHSIVQGAVALCTREFLIWCNHPPPVNKNANCGPECCTSQHDFERHCNESRAFSHLQYQNRTTLRNIVSTILVLQHQSCASTHTKRLYINS
jgi:hypothetical protein